MAEYLLKEMVRRQGLTAQFQIASLLTMDENNARNLRRILPHDPDGKIRPLLSFAGLQRGIADPWYTDDFGTTYDDLVLGCTAFLDALRRRGNI